MQRLDYPVLAGVTPQSPEGGSTAPNPHVCGALTPARHGQLQSGYVRQKRPHFHSMNRQGAALLHSAPPPSSTARFGFQEGLNPGN